MNEVKRDTNRNRANVYKVYSISELANIFGLTRNEIDALITKEMLTAVYVGQGEQWSTGKARPRYYLPLTPQNEAILEQRTMFKRCYRYTKSVEALALEKVENAEAILNELKEQNEINTIADLFGFCTYG